MREERLLERIRTWENEPHRRSSSDFRRQVNSLLSHLQRILNTRQGNVPISGTYGIPDLLEFMTSYPESVTGIEKTIREAIACYEPRLSDVKVVFMPQDEDLLCLRFQIQARLSAGAGRNILIETIVDSDGKISLAG
ncbi:MAG TPA: type VI secretion system baseplate subunit TssE [Smithellaceae bacterium]|jgi:type VI secretion system protein|nr:type VI secretion system baseplate subunit TssE [Syntrophaceae bacterium]OQC55435.1 MAG: Gene 25-like lysozyme [Deltaproteobacteria bacterium ADurb.Bin022]HPV49307.1 type VI secretion system baseplate subunit TssE [Smithellaceae bacterium]